MAQNIAGELGVTPRVIGRYELITPLGEGGMACVYLAVQRGPIANKLVVVKLLREQLTSDEQFVAMFTDESRIAALLNHPNVIHTYESSSTDSHYYIVMEFLEGKTLSQLLRRVGRQQFPLALHLWVICEVLAGLHYAHELSDFGGTPLDIVHRDVSPSNILITARGEVKLLDFGIAKAQGAVAETQHGIVKGKLGYASPEQCFGQKSDARSDIYSVGVMLWEALAGKRRPMREVALLMSGVASPESESETSEVFASVPPELVRIVRRATAVAPADRYQKAIDFELELRRFLSATSSNAALTLQKLIVEHFGGELAAIRRAIDEQVGSVRYSSAPEPRPVTSEVTSEVRTLAAPRTARTSAAVQPPQPHSNRRRGLAALGVVVVGLGVFWLFLSAQRSHRASLHEDVARAIDSPNIEAAATALPAPVAAAPRISEPPPEASAAEQSAPPADSAAAPRALHPRSWRQKARSVTSSSPRGSTAKASPFADSRAQTPLPRTDEPGLDLRRIQTSLPVRSLDERDPYVP